MSCSLLGVSNPARAGLQHTWRPDVFHSSHSADQFQISLILWYSWILKYNFLKGWNHERQNFKSKNISTYIEQQAIMRGFFSASSSVSYSGYLTWMHWVRENSCQLHHQTAIKTGNVLFVAWEKIRFGFQETSILTTWNVWQNRSPVSSNTILWRGVGCCTLLKGSLWLHFLS